MFIGFGYVEPNQFLVFYNTLRQLIIIGDAKK